MVGHEENLKWHINHSPGPVVVRDSGIETERKKNPSSNEYDVKMLEHWSWSALQYFFLLSSLFFRFTEEHGDERTGGKLFTFIKGCGNTFS